ncbi:MAG: hypothetical protein WCH34_18835 [Bacteroidota bacterium]
MTTTKKCLNCGAEFNGRTNRLYCTDKCRIAAFYNKGNVSENIIENENLFNDDTNKQLTNLNSKLIEQLISVEVKYTNTEKNALEEQAKRCGVELSKYIRIRSQMDITDTSRMEDIITKQRSEIDELKVKLNFYQQGSSIPKEGNEKHAGLYVKMNEKQKEFLIKRWLESHDHDFSSSTSTLSNGKQTSNQAEWLIEEEKQFPGYIVGTMNDEMIVGLLCDIEERLIKYCSYSPEDFEDDSIFDQFEELDDYLKSKFK